MCKAEFNLFHLGSPIEVKVLFDKTPT